MLTYFWILFFLLLSGSSRSQPTGDVSDPTLNSICRVPPYATPREEVAANSSALLLAEGRCYLSCLRNATERITSFIASGGIYEETRKWDFTYPSWPFPALNETSGQQQEIHECIRGCRILLHDVQLEMPFKVPAAAARDIIIDDCINTCENECRAECGGNLTCHSDQVSKLRLTRSINCARLHCHVGCWAAEYILSTSMPPSPPSAPIASPTLTALTNWSEDTFMAGQYSIDLTAAAPPPPPPGPSRANPNPPPLHLVGFLFKIEDVVSGNVSMIWQHDPREVLDLSSHACREVEVSFAVVNREGATEFSDPTLLLVYGARDLYFMMNGKTYSSGSRILISNIGTASSPSDPDSSLVCVTSEVNSQCCRESDGGNVGEWYFPDGSLVPRNREVRKIIPRNGDSLGSNFTRSGYSQQVRLNRRNEAFGPAGVYTCKVPTEDGLYNYTANITIELPSVIDVQTFRCSITVWTPPAGRFDTFLGYDIRYFIPGTEEEAVLQTDMSKFFQMTTPHVIMLLPQGKIFVQVRVRLSADVAGPYSEPVALCPETAFIGEQ